MKIIKKLAFFVHHPEMINHWNNIFNDFDKSKFDVIINQDSDEEKVYLKREKISYVYLDDILKNKIAYLYLISNHVGGKISRNRYLIENLALFNIRYLYALGKSKWNFDTWNHYYDMILCMGPHQVSKLEFCNNTILKEIGYSRYDDFFNKKFDKKDILKQLNCDINKKTIIWLPTWDKLCSIDSFYNSISELTKEYNVIVKPHPLTISHEKEKMKLLDSSNFTKVIKTNFNTLFLYIIADFIICDYGGPAFGAIYTDKNLILLNLETEKKSPYLEKDSPDIFIRNNIININPNKSDLLPQILKNKEIWSNQKEERALLRKKYFTQNYGKSTDSFLKILNNLDQYLPYSKWDIIKYKLKKILL